MPELNAGNYGLLPQSPLNAHCGTMPTPELEPHPPKTLEECQEAMRQLGYSDERIENLCATLNVWVERLLDKYFDDLYGSDS